MIRLTDAAASVIKEVAKESTDGSETGGLLLGRALPGLVEIIEAGTPGANAIRTPSTFLRDLEHSRLLAAAAYERDGSEWIGEWHTHPTGPPCPSSVDLRTYRSLLSDHELQFEMIVSLIVTPRLADSWDEVELTGWVFTSVPGGLHVARHSTTVAQLRDER